MPTSSFHSELFAHFARIGKALASPARVEMVYLLGQGEKSVERLARDARLSVANASHHLQVLKAARLVEFRKMGQQVRYRLASPTVEAMWQCLQRIGEDRLAEIQELTRTYLERRDEMEPVSRRELLERMARHEVVVLDVRPVDEFAAGHLPQAMSMPLRELKSRLRELPRSLEIVAYCRGPYCLLSFDAIDLLRAEGYQAVRLEEGFPEWKAERLPVEYGQPEAS